MKPVGYDIKNDRFYISQGNEKRIDGLLTCCVHIGYECNLRCSYCLSPYYKENLKEIPVNSIVQFIKEQAIPRVVVSGGEPFMYTKKLFELAKKLKEIPTALLVSTNGLLINPNNPEIKEVLEYIDWIDISLPAATKTTYKALRGIDGFEKVISTITELISKNHSVRLSFNITKDNLSEFKAFLDLAKKLNVTNIRISETFEANMPLENNLLTEELEVGHIQIKNVYFPLSEEQLKHYREGYLVIRHDGTLFKCSTIDQCIIGSIDSGINNQILQNMITCQKKLFLS